MSTENDITKVLEGVDGKLGLTLEKLSNFNPKITFSSQKAVDIIYYESGNGSGDKEYSIFTLYLEDKYARFSDECIKILKESPPPEIEKIANYFVNYFNSEENGWTTNLFSLSKALEKLKGLSTDERGDFWKKMFENPETPD